jgi:hypothetical protein
MLRVWTPPEHAHLIGSPVYLTVCPICGLADAAPVFCTTVGGVSCPGCGHVHAGAISYIRDVYGRICDLNGNPIPPFSSP